ncbi:MAG TPA: NIPSNAP family containing protein [Acidimicrobiia bacterium]|nr:NIPSNAP family containing protein [Acidimicrobiia bacterium]
MSGERSEQATGPTPIPRHGAASEASAIINTKIYIHELVDIIGHNRARYMQHMTANWGPIGRAERNMLCFAVWGTVGSTGRWPEVVNLWELDGWEGLAANFEHELTPGSMQDESLAKWWAVAAELRRGGHDRIVVPEPWSPTSEELTSAGGAHAVAYAHEMVTLPVGGARAFLDDLRQVGVPAVESFGLRAIGAYRVAMINDSEAIVIWSIPDWETWIAYERAWDDGSLRAWRARLVELGADVRRMLLCDAPLSPLRTGRQPQVEDRIEWDA